MKVITTLFTLAFCCGLRAADVALPKMFSDNMMFQRDMPVRVWGTADPGEKITATLGGKSASAKADTKGAWLVELPAFKEGVNLELEVKGKNTLTLKNIIIGDIWICSGQSNMEMQLGGCVGAVEDIKAADLPLIRRIKVNHEQAPVPAADVPAQGPWQVCSPGTVGQFTAVGFYFAREIHAKTGVPIGILDVNWGGTKIEPWTPAEGLELVEEFKPLHAAKMESIKAYREQLPAALDQLERWIATTRADLAAGAEVSAPPTIPAPKDRAWSGMYNRMVHPWIKMPIKGALWYQGESNGTEGETYYQKMSALIGGWRKQWGQGDFPFYFVQLASYQAAKEDPAGGDGWAKLREAQRKALGLPNTGMAVIIDTVPLAQAGNIHPVNKADVGMRLSRWALHRDYGQKEVLPSGPLFKELNITGNKAVVTFDHTGSGLMVGKKEGRQPAVADDGGKLKRFAIAGADKKWFWADAVIENHTVVLTSPSVPEPVAVRYAFSMNPHGANLYNREGLPASPFRTDDW